MNAHSPDPVLQHRAIAALTGCTADLGMPMVPPPGLPPGQWIARLLGAVSALYDEFAINPRLYERPDGFPTTAARGYMAAAVHLNTGHARAGIATRLTQYAAVLQPPELLDTADPVTAAAVAALNFAVKMLALHTFAARDDRVEHLLAAFGDLSDAVRNHTEVLGQQDHEQAGGAPGASS